MSVTPLLSPSTCFSTRTVRLWIYKHQSLNNALTFICSIRFWFSIMFILLCMTFLGIFTNLIAKSPTAEDFHYPLEGDIQLFVNQLKTGQKPWIEPINVFNYTYLKSCQNKCSRSKSPILLIVVKSALSHFNRRQAIRETWGKEDEDISTVFLLGTNSDLQLQSQIDFEDQHYHDIVQSDFVDYYYNNTLKTMSGFKWVFNFCPDAHYMLFADDDMYVSVKNLFRFLRNPVAYARAPNFNHSRSFPEELNNEVQENISVFQLKQDLRNKYSDESLFAGYVFRSAPLRLLGSKWYVSLKEYPYNMWPPYATAGAYVLSRKSFTDMYYAMLYTKLFRFDDVFLGLAALKANIKLLHCPHVYFEKKHYSLEGYRDVVASHGYGDPSELTSVWNEQKNAGRA